MNHSVLSLSILGLLTATGCGVVDGDVSGAAAISPLDLSVNADQVVDRLAVISGNVHLNYTSTAETVDIEVLDNGVSVYSTSASADAADIPLDLTVDLLHEGANTLTVLVDYNGQTATQTLGVLLPTALQSFALNPSTAPATALLTTVSGNAALGFKSDQQAVLTIKVNGQSVSTSSLDASQSDALSFSAPVPLSQEGLNQIEAVLTYQGRQLSDSYSVNVPAGIQSLSLLPVAPPSTLSAHITGTAALGYTSSNPAQLDVFVDGALAASQHFDGNQTAIQFDAPVTLAHAGASDVVVTLNYGQTTLTDSLTLVVPEGVQTFALNPAAATVDVYSVQVTGDATLGYTSNTPAVLDILVDGATVYSASYDASQSANLSFDVALPLNHAGASDIVARLTYDGSVYTDAFSVTVAPPAPIVDVNTRGWSFDLNPGTRATLSGDINVTTPAGWTTAGVYTSIDGGVNWLSATLDLSNPGQWRVVLNNPDIGLNSLLIRVDSANRGRVQSDISSTDFTVDAVFDCRRSSSMSPSTELFRNNGFETRTMLGYFGDPNGGHSITFTLHSKNKKRDRITSTGALLRYGTFGIEESFNVDRMDCNNNTCSQEYDLEVIIDGKDHCYQGGFGQITTF